MVLLNGLYMAYQRTNKWLDKATKKGTWSEFDQKVFDATKRINPFIDMYIDRYNRERYMDRNNLDYPDVRQPWKLPGGSDAGGVSHMVQRSLNFFSSNISRLYEDDEDPAKEWMEKQYRADFRR